MNDLFKRLAGFQAEDAEIEETQPDQFNSFHVPNDSPFAIVMAHHATRGESKKINQLKEYLMLRQSRDQGDSYDVDRFDVLLQAVSKEYLLHTDADHFLKDDYAGTDEGKDFQNRFFSLRKYLFQFSDGENVVPAVQQAMERSNEANRRRRSYAKVLQKDVRQGNKVWDTEGSAWDGAEYLEQNFPDMLQRSLDVTIGRINTAIRVGNEVSGDNSLLSEEYAQSMRNINHFLDTFNQREEVTLLDLMYYIGEHRDTTTFRDSTSQYYSDYEALVAGITHTMPSQETQRENIDLIHNCVDPEFNDLTHALKLSYLNVKHNIGLTTQDIDIYSTATSSISNIMRAFGVSEMDDRSKQYFHNSGDHSLRTILTIVSIRDANKARFERMHEKGEVSSKQLAQQENLSNQTTAYMCKMACLHDTGEYLGELLGNNLVGRSVLEERFLRILRDQTEEHIMKHVIPEELQHRLNIGDSSSRWQDKNVNEYIKDSLNPPNEFRFDTSFYSTIFDTFERLQTNHDIISLREVGRINQEGHYENAINASEDDVLYTMQYVYSKITGHKFHTTDSADIAAFNDSEYDRKRAKDDYYISNRVASDTGSPLPHDPDVTRIQDLHNTALPLDTFMEEKDVEYGKSLFKKLVQQTLDNYENLPEEEAMDRQAHDEAMLHGLCYEMNHYARKLAKTSNLDRQIIDKATRKSIAQGIVLANSELQEHGIELQHLEVPDQVLTKKRYRVASVNTSRFMGGFLGDPDKPDQLFEPVQDIVRSVESIAKTAKSEIVSPLWKVAKTPVQALTLIDLDHVTEDDFKRLFQISSVLEAGGDLSLGVTGLAEGVSTADGGFDPKSLAVLNPLLTFTLAKPQRYAEAIEKCYGHVLHMHGDKIAQKYGLEESIDYLKTRSNLEKGPYYKKPTDITLSGELAEKMYHYFDAQYEALDKTNKLPDHRVKGFETIEKAEKYILREMIKAGCDRSSFLLAVGGGIVCDIAGFAASIFLRGIRFGFVSTSLLSQVDASVGGKNGVNLDAFKNMVGVFNQPEFVLCDINMLSTLPDREISNGLAEIVKHGQIKDRSLLEFIENNRDKALALDRETVFRMVADSVDIKSRVVQADEREAGERRKLNFGHTIGHAFEKLDPCGHGSAVSAGMVAAAQFSQQKGYINQGDVDRIKDLLLGLGLPVAFDFPPEQIIEAASRDKKKQGSNLFFVFLGQIGQARVEDISYDDLNGFIRDYFV